MLVALLGLSTIWLLFRMYYAERVRHYRKFSKEEIALVKIIKDNAGRIWENHRPGRKVIRREDWEG